MKAAVVVLVSLALWTAGWWVGYDEGWEDGRDWSPVDVIHGTPPLEIIPPPYCVIDATIQPVYRPPTQRPYRPLMHRACFQLDGLDVIR